MRTAAGRLMDRKGAASWTPASLTSLAAWYKGDAGVTDAGSGAVSVWADQSGNGRDITQATGSKRPTTGVDSINGVNVLKFVRANLQSLNRSAVTLSQPLTVYAVVKLAALGTSQVILGNGADPEATLYNDSTNKWSMYAGTGRVGSISSTTSAVQLVATFNGASSTLWVGGVSATIGNPGGNGRTELTVGNDGNALGGDIGELVLQSAVGTAGELTSWNTYCARFGL